MFAPSKDPSSTAGDQHQTGMNAQKVGAKGEETMGERRLKYLDMLQSVISRMASNQFTIRTWSIGLGTAVMGYVAAKDQHPTAAMLALLPASVFWLLDGYYLALERKF